MLRHLMVINHTAWYFRKMHVLIEQKNISLSQSVCVVYIAYILEGEPAHADILDLADFIEIVPKGYVCGTPQQEPNISSPLNVHGVLAPSPIGNPEKRATVDWSSPVI
ncbi:MAG TPA: hypothetical protein VN328_04135 [Thermodesulfovibrionales bacterium]|nr:hypothetical protein [Thermodesulfovibrionales bacterium]